MDISNLRTFKIEGKTCIALVRRMTERECGRLMDVDDADITRIQESGVCSSAQYRLFGNSIVVSVLYHIFRKAFIPGQRNNEQAEEDLLSSCRSIISGQWNHEHPLRVFTLCSGYGSQELALERLKRDYPPFDYKIVGWAEFDPESKTPIDEQPAVVAYRALHPEASDLNYGDMTKIDWNTVPDFDLLFYSTPCQDISQAGRGAGLDEGSGTRSSLVWYVRDALNIKHPRFACWENVAGAVSQTHCHNVHRWMRVLEEIGYTNAAQLLNAKQFGVPQNRLRTFLFSIFDPTGEVCYNFPSPFPLTRKVTDMLEPVVDSRYYLNPLRVQQWIDENVLKIQSIASADSDKIEPLPDRLRQFIEQYESD